MQLIFMQIPAKILKCKNFFFKNAIGSSCTSAHKRDDYHFTTRDS